jgi:aspartate racemase
VKTIGLIGGITWESTIEYYRIINKEVQSKLGGYHSAKIVLASVNFAEIEKAQHEGDWDTVTKILVTAANQLESAGADFLLLCTNTLHKVAENVEKEITIPLLHIADAVASEIKNAGLDKVGLLGTSFTMEEDFYKEKLTACGIDVIVPSKQERQLVNDVIFKELCFGKIIQESKKAYIEICENLSNRGAKGIVFGCTEIGFLLSDSDINQEVFDSVEIHAKLAVEEALR